MVNWHRFLVFSQLPPTYTQHTIHSFSLPDVTSLSIYSNPIPPSIHPLFMFQSLNLISQREISQSSKHFSLFTDPESYSEQIKNRRLREMTNDAYGNMSSSNIFRFIKCFSKSRQLSHCKHWTLFVNKYLQQRTKLVVNLNQFTPHKGTICFCCSALFQEWLLSKFSSMKYLTSPISNGFWIYLIFGF